MSRDSRFDKLEKPRAEAPAASAPSLARFEAAAPSPSGPEAVQLPLTAGLPRFEEDGAAGVRLDSSALVDLPMLRCARCQRDSGKFDTVCLSCGASLTTPAAVELNLRLLAERRAEQEAEAQARDAERSVALEKTLLEQSLHAQTVEEALRRDAPRLGLGLRTSLTVGVGGLLLVLLTRLWFGPSRAVLVLFVEVGLALAAARVWRLMKR